MNRSALLFAWMMLAFSIAPCLAASVCDFDGDGDCDIDDIDLFGDAIVANNPQFDLDGSGIVNRDDVFVWLGQAATENGFASPYQQGDTDLDRDIDITDSKGPLKPFDPLGTRVGTWRKGDYNADLVSDIVDWNIIWHNFNPGGYGVERPWNDGQAPPWGPPDPTPISLVVDQVRSKVNIVTARGKVQSFQVVSPGAGLTLPPQGTRFDHQVLTAMLWTSDTAYSETAFGIDGSFDGEITLNTTYDAPGGVGDLLFKYTQIDAEHGIVGAVLYSSEGKCDFDSDGDCDIDDIDQFTGQIGHSSATHDLDGNGTVQPHDQLLWLSLAAMADGHPSMYLRGDFDLDRDVDVTDFNTLATNFDAGGFNAATNRFSLGDSDGDGDIDITDFNRLATDFAPGGYDAHVSPPAAVLVPEPGELTLLFVTMTLAGWRRPGRHRY